MGPVTVLLLSTYDMGRQPFGLASPAAWLREAGANVTCVDVTREKLADERIGEADVVGFFLPMHTATRLALPVIDRVRTFMTEHATIETRGLVRLRSAAGTFNGSPAAAPGQPPRPTVPAAFRNQPNCSTRRSRPYSKNWRAPQPT